jgi:hypothetical protein
MGRLGFVLIAVAGCAAGTGQVSDPAAVRAGQEEVCAAVVAEHDGMAVEQVTATWDRATPEGTAIVTVQGPGSLHTCEVDGALRVREVLHPGH